MENVKDKIEKQLKESGSISATDVSNIVKEVKEVPQEQRGIELDKATVVTLDDKIKNDPIISQAAKGNTSGLLEEDVATAASVFDNHKNLLLESEQINKEVITITPDEKTAFISAILNNSRFVLPFSFMNNKLSVKIRSRTQAESYAMFHLISRELNAGQFDTQLAYSTRLRNIMITAQVAEVNGVTYPELKLPLLAVGEGDKINPPGWVDQIKTFETKPDALLDILFKVIRIFEYKYLTMIDSADKQNFWKTEQST